MKHTMNSLTNRFAVAYAVFEYDLRRKTWEQDGDLHEEKSDAINAANEIRGTLRNIGIDPRDLVVVVPFRMEDGNLIDFSEEDDEAEVVAECAGKGR